MTPECAPDFTYLSTGLSLLDTRAKFHQSRKYLFSKCAALKLFKILSRKPIVQDQTFDKMGPADPADPGADFTIIHKTVHVSDRRRGPMGRQYPVSNQLRKPQISSLYM